jgi:chromosome segregation ATPase
MAKGKRKNLTKRNQDHSLSSELSTPTSANPGYPNTPEKQDSYLKSYPMMLVEDIKKYFNNSHKEIQENTAKEVEVLKEKQKNTTKQVMELNKTIQNLKREVETIKKTQNETTLEIETLGKKSGTIDVSISNRYKRWKRESQMQKIP